MTQRGHKDGLLLVHHNYVIIDVIMSDMILLGRILLLLVVVAVVVVVDVVIEGVTLLINHHARKLGDQSTNVTLSISGGSGTDGLIESHGSSNAGALGGSSDRGIVLYCIRHCWETDDS